MHAQLQPGDVLAGKYVIERALGAGGMGEVFVARQRPFDRPVALKFMHKELAERADMSRRFFQEARAVSQLSHPNTVTVFDFGEIEDVGYFIAMEYVDGMPLSDWIHTHGALRPEDAVPLAVQIAQSLGEAHYKGIIHRDLKPDNVMVSLAAGAAPFVKVLDFGIAKVLGGSGIQTAHGNLVGTPLYMAPEQARGEEVDGRTDLYSLGCCLYEMMTGSPPYGYGEDNPMRVLMLHQQAEIPDLPAHLPFALRRFGRRALAKSREERPADANTFIAELMACFAPSRSWESGHGLAETVEGQIGGSGPFASPMMGLPAASPIASPPLGLSPVPGEQRGGTFPSPVPFYPAAISSDSSERSASRSGEGEGVHSSQTRLAPAEAVDDEPAGGPGAVLTLVLGLVALVALGGGYLALASPEAAAVSFDSDPPGALVIVDGVAIGPTPLRYQLEAGPVAVEIVEEGYEPYRLPELVVDGGAEQRVFGQLQRRVLELEIVPPIGGAELLVNGADFGRLSARGRTLRTPWPEAALEVELRHPGYEDHRVVLPRETLQERTRIVVTRDDLVPR